MRLLLSLSCLSTGFHPKSAVCRVWDWHKSSLKKSLRLDWDPFQVVMRLTRNTIQSISSEVDGRKSFFFFFWIGDGGASQNLIDVLFISPVLTTCFYFPACFLTESPKQQPSWVSVLNNLGELAIFFSPSLCNSSAPHLQLWFVLLPATPLPPPIPPLPRLPGPQSYLALAVWCFSSGAISQWNHNSPFCSWSDPAVRQHFA